MDVLNERLDSIDLIGNNIVEYVRIEKNIISIILSVNKNALPFPIDGLLARLRLDINYSNINDISYDSSFKLSGSKIVEFRDIGRRIMAIRFNANGVESFLNLSYKSFNWSFVY